MINILVPLSGASTFKVSSENKYPRILNEIDGKLLIERAAKPFLELKQENKITVALPQPQANKYQLNNILKILGSQIKSCAINGNTQGSACSALLAIEELELDSPLIITSFEQVLDFDINIKIQQFIDEGVDAGVFTFDAMHPKWSFVKVDKHNFVTQAAEKMPISNKAVAGLYYFKSANLFIESAKAMIRKDVKTNDSFFIAPTLNEIILNKGKVKAIDIDKSNYFHITDDHALENYEQKIIKNGYKEISEILRKTEEYVIAFNSKSIDRLVDLFSDDFVLVDPAGEFKGQQAVYDYIKNIFDEVNNLLFTAKKIYQTEDMYSIIEFELIIDGKKYSGTDVIKWNKELQMEEMKAYLFEKADG
ncbi:nuclear transport factor 2 family protein [Vibrio atlanticus]|uniref:nuclear transport factor 2 family protein n=1 Tax=Vibrio atlanticus TaxID=693153 RepID=UPI003D12D71A